MWRECNFRWESLVHAAWQGYAGILCSC